MAAVHISGGSLGLNDPSRTCVDIRVCGHTFRMLQKPESGNHGMCVWEAAHALVHLLQASPALLDGFAGKRILETGAGCGLVGLVIAHTHTERARESAALRTKVTMTDLPDVVPHTAACAIANGFHVVSSWAEAEAAAAAKAVSSGRPTVCVRAYSWGEPVASLAEDSPGGYDVVVGTDVVYSKALVRPLLLSVARICAWSEGRTGGKPEARDKAAAPVAVDASEGIGAGTTIAGEGGERAPATSAHAAAHRRCSAYIGTETRCTETAAAFVALANEWFHVRDMSLRSIAKVIDVTQVHIFQLRLRHDWEDPGESA